MPKQELTKALIADTLKQLMKQTPLDKISVQKIVDACGLNRKTFYYHFQDKQALICWIFHTEFSSITDENMNGSAIDEMVQHLYRNKSFYVAALTSDVQNNLRDHLYEAAFVEIRQRIQDHGGMRGKSPEDILLVAEFFTNAVLGTITRWVKEGMKHKPEQWYLGLFPLFEDCLAYVLDKAAREKSQ